MWRLGPGKENRALDLGVRPDQASLAQNHVFSNVGARSDLRTFADDGRSYDHRPRFDSAALDDRDPIAQQVWTYDRKTRTFWTSEDPETIRAKMAYAAGLGLRGAMIWEISQDTDEGILLDAVVDGLRSATWSSVTGPS